ncbi:glycoside hydrolase family 19 protein [Pseudomonas vancouverensis]|uniref:Glycoside hydrolase family 19 protein n=1 Tax=Pseudomonas vancouverensis TaxID=95300 RepID=A0A1H2N8F6_PSEVA|nr:glycoside hydrolase family 19 protein [Pseudomonas vancouverensis]KAB0494029.1 glycoside hydrolase family 19 protein [Pseudomonas vancouverensis]TDB61466.1 glycoside hydrolase family 19 protein [Pseudomonas vancouverensis]SDV01813.1 putative chitinase [Pseudomonas vancouverensis]
MPITEQQLLRILPNARPVAGVFVSALNLAMARFDITSPVRQAAFLAQVGHESVSLTKLSESLYYKDPERVALLFKYGFDLNKNGRVDPAEVEFAKGYLRNSEKLANRVYGGRYGNGPEASGDGYKYRGRGLIGITFSDNYRLCGKALGLPLLDRPELLEQPEHAAMSAAWYWWDRGLNELADVGQFDRITRVVNGGDNGRAERLALWATAKGVLCPSSI